MKKMFLFFTASVMLFCVLQPSAWAQGTAKTGPAAVRDSDLEKDALHNLEVARHYFKQKKAYVAALQRCEEIIAANPAFAKIDEVLFIAGESSVNLAEGRGKQSSTIYVVREGEEKHTLTPEEFRAKAQDYLSQLVNDYPQSAFRIQAEDGLKAVGGLKPKGISKQRTICGATVRNDS
jgi:outer membrane protein assembly factor BamD (BamD/ComL family)